MKYETAKQFVEAGDALRCANVLANSLAPTTVMLLTAVTATDGKSGVDGVLYRVLMALLDDFRTPRPIDGVVVYSEFVAVLARELASAWEEGYSISPRGEFLRGVINAMPSHVLSKWCVQRDFRLYLTDFTIHAIGELSEILE